MFILSWLAFGCEALANFFACGGKKFEALHVHSKANQHSCFTSDK
jgi:hypothetical protein